VRKLEQLTIQNFKSIQDQTLALGQLNIFIGGNGSGKSNLIEVFRFLREIVTQNLARYTAIKGGADNLLRFGRKVSQHMELFLQFSEGNTANMYRVRLTGSDKDTLVIWSEVAYYHERLRYPKPYDHPVASGATESRLKQTCDHKQRISQLFFIGCSKSSVIDST
jgi:predicted ATPase